jgi:hypothetical protein
MGYTFRFCSAGGVDAFEFWGESDGIRASEAALESFVPRVRVCLREQLRLDQ